MAMAMAMCHKSYFGLGLEKVVETWNEELRIRITWLLSWGGPQKKKKKYLILGPSGIRIFNEWCKKWVLVTIYYYVVTVGQPLITGIPCLFMDFGLTTKSQVRFEIMFMLCMGLYLLLICHASCGTCIWKGSYVGHGVLW